MLRFTSFACPLFAFGSVLNGPSSAERTAFARSVICLCAFEMYIALMYFAWCVDDC